MYTQEQILDMYFDRNQQAVSATSQMYGAKLTRFADTMVAHEDALECVNDTYIAAWNKIPPERGGPMHGANESAPIDKLLEALKIYILALLRLEEIDF